MGSWNSLLTAGLALVVIAAWNRRVLAPRPTVARLLPPLALALLCPFLIPAEWIYTRALSTVQCVVVAGKTYELFRGRVPDPRMLDRWGSFLFWLFVPLKSQRPEQLADAEQARAAGRARLMRALIKLPPVAVLTLLHLRWPALHDDVWLESFWALWLTYFAVSALVDIVGGLAMQSGNALAEGFDAPPLARSPRDFWSRRWNLVVHDLVFRHVFLPLGGLRRPLRATVGIFALSGFIHEYFVFATLGRLSSYTGYMMVFFGIHGVAVMAQLAWDRGPGRRRSMSRPLAVGLHLAWFTLTAPLFFAPMGEIFAGAWPN